MNNLRISLLLYISFCLYSAHGDNSRDCVVTAEEGSPRVFLYSRDARQDGADYKWEMDIRGRRVVVATTAQPYQSEGFLARSEPSPDALPGWQDLYLYVTPVTRFMTYLQCSSLYNSNAYIRLYGYCRLVIFVRPTVPVCDSPRFDQDRRVMEIPCHTLVHPQGVCNFTYENENGRAPAERDEVKYSHVYSYTTGLYTTTCTLVVPFADITWNRSFTVGVSAAPDIKDQQDYAVNTTRTFHLAIVKPSEPKCDELKVHGFDSFLEVTCESEVLPWGICEFNFTVGLSPSGPHSPEVTYEHSMPKADEPTTTSRTRCTAKVPLASVPWNQPFAAQVKMAPGPIAANDSDLWVTGNWTVPFYKERPRLVSFMANQNNAKFVNLSVDDNLRLTCMAAGNPGVQLYLVEDGGQVLHTSDVPNSLDYVIDGVNCTHSAEYECRMVNETAGGLNVTVSVQLGQDQYQSLRPVCDPPVISDMDPYVNVTCRSSVTPFTRCHAVFQSKDGTTVPTSSRVFYTSVSRPGYYLTECLIQTNISELLPRMNYQIQVEFSAAVKGCSATRRSEWSRMFYFDVPEMTYFTANDQVGTVHFKTGDTLNIRCIASGTPKPTMSLTDDQGVVLYVSDFAGTLAFTVYNLDCARSNEYTCQADNGFSVSDTIVSVGKCPSEASSFDFLPVKIAVPVIVLVGVLIVAVCCCRRCRSKGKRQTPETAMEVGPRGLSQTADGMHTRSGPYQPTAGTTQNHMSQSLQNGACRSDRGARPDLNTRDEAFLIGVHNGDKGALFLILASSKQNPSMDLQHNSSNTRNGQTPWSHSSAPITSSAAYDAPSFTPPEYTEIPTQQGAPGPYNNQPLEYRLGDSMDV